MRVLYVIDSLVGGGAEHSLAHMAPGFRAHDVELHVAFLKSRWDVADDLEESGATLHPVALDSGRLRQMVALVALIRSVQPDVVHTTLWEADILGRTAAAVARTPVVTTFANVNYSDSLMSDPALRRSKVRAAQLVDISTARLAVGFHAVSEHVRSEMVHQMRLPADRIEVIPRARRRERLGEPSTRRRNATRDRLEIAGDQPVLLAIGRQEHQKGFDVLIDAMDRVAESLPEARLLIVGRDGRSSGALARQVEELGLRDRVHFLGHRSDVADLIVAADLVVVSSREEGLPGAVLEAMALECPVVATDLPVVREAIGESAVGLVPRDDPTALAQAIERAIGTDTSALTDAARARFDREFQPERVAGHLAEFYRRAVTSSRWSRMSRT